MRLPHIMEDNLLYLKSASLNVNLIPKHSQKASKIMFDHVSGHYGPAKLTHQINDYTTLKKKKN